MIDSYCHEVWSKLYKSRKPLLHMLSLIFIHSQILWHKIFGISKKLYKDRMLNGFIVRCVSELCQSFWHNSFNLLPRVYL